LRAEEWQETEEKKDGNKKKKKRKKAAELERKEVSTGQQREQWSISQTDRVHTLKIWV
jgi:hypothetical protein